MIKIEYILVGKIGGQWIGKRENLQRWIDQQTGGEKLGENQPVKVCEFSQVSTPQNGEILSTDPMDQ